MPTLTAEQITDLQGDIGITDNQDVFTDEELQRLYDRAGASHDLTVVLALRQLLAQSARLYKYTAGNTSEDRQQVFAQLRRLLADWEARAGVAGGRLTTGTISLNLDQPETTS